MQIKYIFFDFDGVLAESVNIKTEAFRQMYLHHGNEFAEKVVTHHVENGGVSRFEKFKIYNGEWLGEEINEARIRELAEIYGKKVVEGVIQSKEVEGATDFLKNANHFHKYVITGTPTHEIRIILEKRNMNQYFIEAFGSPEKKDFWVRKIINENNINPAECVFIGDALADYEAAVSNKIPFILRETPEAKHLFLDFNGPRINDLSSLHQILQKDFGG